METTFKPTFKLFFATSNIPTKEDVEGSARRFLPGIEGVKFTAADVRALAGTRKE